MRVDAHHHLWSYDPASYRWIDPASWIARDFSTDDLMEAMVERDIDHAIAIQARQIPEETRALLAVVAHCPAILGVVGWIDLKADGIAEHLEADAAPRLVGYRHIVQDEPEADFLLDDAFVRGVRAVVDSHLAFDLLVDHCQLATVPTFLDRVGSGLNDILIAQFRKASILSDLETSFVQQAFYLGYFLFAVPSAMVTRAHGYKAAIVTVLLLYATGALLFYPAAHFGEYRYFLAALFVVAAGLAFLETSANPLMAEIGDPAGAARRLNWAQAANPVGTVVGVLVGKYFILSEIAEDKIAVGTAVHAARGALSRQEVMAVQTPYLAIGLVVLIFAAAAVLIRFPGRSLNPGDDAHLPFAVVLGRPRLLKAAATQFFYVGAQVGLWSYTIRYAQANLPGIRESAAADYLFASLALFGISRFVGSSLMGRIAPPLLLTGFAAGSLLLASITALFGGLVGLIALVVASFFMSIQFPTIFALGMTGLGPLARAGASLIVMAIIGGAALTALMGAVSDHAGINAAMLVPALAFGIVLLFGLSSRRAGRAAAPLSPHVV